MKKALITMTVLLFAASMSFSQVESDTTETTNQQTITDTTETTQPPAEQVKKEKPKKEKKSTGNKLFAGGSVGLSFGNYTRIAVYPQLGYRFTPKLSVGVEVGYEYIKDNRYASSYETYNYGASIFARYRLIPQLYFHVEPAFYNYEINYWADNSYRDWVTFLFVGAGFVQKVGASSFLYAQVKFDVLQNSNSPYSDWAPFWNIGMSVGF